MPVTLTGRFVRLEPLTLAHIDALADVGLHPELWTWIPTQVRTRDEMRTWVATALADEAHGLAMPFVIIDIASNGIIGSSRYANISTSDRRVEIGWTWITPSFQRTPANSEAKLLLLTHAFEVMGCIRVELKTDALNQQSRRAILRLGAVEEGTFRRNRITPSGRVRDTVYFSILDSEWPAVKARLIASLS